ncbi:hypothetical protein COCSUDRAFT_68177 [Coccomyxa subellipsoidea C-169]|uniref:Uncharacterized protein n=1 Tax=Coccomyxa subellipsoidea (strain C-169) TaxID=574566 RepID=I0YK15_COCSC|nr:hypothetical protein COCSUDRAFT_68177 [Coccomyxa subellipsoidea C-169]EIE18734.1 hypothetical protein COCSUDRAFT_68177 [Coccomyxa subellipsoidea C-169]|eukprot:XP_005643278.1 hypothetical protein COCSUDRAFT_68177 [Coccomyxa subellipsoidea C-169]
MQQKQARTQSGALRERDPDRFYCPYPNCTRSFAELWRLKVHYRAPPDARGSGKERGHGCELQFCPKCAKELKAGKHHVGCFAGRAGAKQAAKRSKAQEDFGKTQTVEIDMKRRCSAPVGGDWRLPPALPEDFSAALDACRPSYPHPIQSQSRGASSQDSEASQPLQPSQKKRRTVDGRIQIGEEEGGLVRCQSTSLADLHLSGCGHFSMDSCADVLLPEPHPCTSGSEGTPGGPLHRTISAPPLASALPQQRSMKESLFDFTSIFDGDVLADSPPPQHKRPPAVCNIHATSASDVLLELPGFCGLYDDDHIMRAMIVELAGTAPQPPQQPHHRRYGSAHPTCWDHDMHAMDSQVARDSHTLTSAHSAPHRHTPPLSPAGPLPLDALLGFSGTSGESSPQHSGPSMAACGSSASGRGSASLHTQPHSPPLPQFPSFGDDLNYLQDGRFGWHDKHILSPPEHPYFSLEAYSTHKHRSMDGRGKQQHQSGGYMGNLEPAPLSPDTLMHPADSDSRRWSPLSEQTQTFRHC